MLHRYHAPVTDPSPDVPDDAEEADPEMPDNTETDE